MLLADPATPRTQILPEESFYHRSEIQNAPVSDQQLVKLAFEPEPYRSPFFMQWDHQRSQKLTEADFADPSLHRSPMQLP